MSTNREIAERIVGESIAMPATSPITTVQAYERLTAEIEAALTAKDEACNAAVEKARREENEACQESVKRYLSNVDIWPSEPPQSKAALNALVDIKARLVLHPLNNGSSRLTAQQGEARPDTQKGEG